MGSCIFGRRLSLWRVPGVGADMSARRKHEEIVSYSRTLGPRSAVRGRDSGARRLHGTPLTGAAAGTVPDRHRTAAPVPVPVRAVL